MKKVKWGVIGTADIAQRETIPGMQKADNCELYAIAGRSLEKAENYKERFGFEKAYGSYQELLDDEQVEAVYIPLPNNLHKEWVLKAAKAGKHILCEKPMSGSAKDVEEMVNVCEEAGVILMEAFAYLHSPIVRALKNQIESGLIGEVNMIESVFHTPGYEDNIRIRRETLGGSIYDLGCYSLSLASWLYSAFPVDGKAVAYFNEEHIDDFTSAILAYPDNKRAMIGCSMFPYQRGDRTFIYGSEGTLEVPVSFNAEGVQTWYRIKDNVRTEYRIEIPNNYMLEVEQLGRCILDGEKPHVSNAFSIAHAKSMDMLLESCGY